MDQPEGLFLDETHDCLFIAEFNGHRVTRFDRVSTIESGASASVQFGTGTPGCSSTQLNRPSALTGDGSSLWVAEFNNRVVRFANAHNATSQAEPVAVLGKPNFVSCTDDTASRSNIGFPNGLALDSFGTLFVGDFTNSRVLIFLDAVSKSNGAPADFLIGQTNFTSSSSPSPTATSVLNPTGLFFDKLFSGSLLVASINEDRLLRFCSNPSATPSGPSRSKSSAVCGNGIVEGSEQCDPPSKLGCCNSACQWKSVGTICDQPKNSCLKPRRCSLTRTNGRQCSDLESSPQRQKLRS